MNANWVAGAGGEDGAFELMIVTTDDRQHFVSPSPAAMTALVALAQADTVLVWDPADGTLIAANLRGTMPWTRGLTLYETFEVMLKVVGWSASKCQRESPRFCRVSL